MLILVLSSLAAALALHTLLSLAWFSKEITSYVHETSVTVSKSLALQVRMELEGHEKLIDPVIRSIDFEQFRFTKESSDQFARQDRLEHVQIYHQVQGSVYEKVDHLYLPERSIQSFVPGGEIIDGVLKAAAQTGLSIQGLAGFKMHFIVAQKVANQRTKKHAIVLSVYKAADLFESFASPSAYRNYLVGPNLLAMEPQYTRKTAAVTIDSARFFSPIFERGLPFGVAELAGASGEEVLASFAKVGKAGLFVASVIEQGAASKTLQSLLVRSGLLGLALLSAAALFSMLATSALTSSLRALSDATRKMAAGQFDVALDIDSKDEVHQVADGLATMAKTLPRFMNETAEKDRLSNEMKAVTAAHDMLFPEAKTRIGPVDIACVYEPARDCGGTWWSYSVIGDEVYVWIGDVTGRGAQTLLIASAARAVASIVEMVPDVSPSAAMRIVNHAICATARGRLTMTFFLAAINMKTGMMKYSCAGHELPVVVPELDRPKLKDLVTLAAHGGPRLGEDAAAQFGEGTHRLNPGDTVFIYTAGVTGLESANNETLGPRRLLNLLLGSLTLRTPVAQKVENLKKELDAHRGEAELADDVSLVALKYEPGIEA